jgi:hypothetical protein
MPPSVAELLAELRALADASIEALSRLREGDERGVAEMLERREHVLTRLADAGVSTASPRDAEAAAALIEAGRGITSLDGDIVALLRSQQAAVARELERLGHARQMLKSYGGSRPGSALFVERLG